MDHSTVDNRVFILQKAGDENFFFFLCILEYVLRTGQRVWCSTGNLMLKFASQAMWGADQVGLCCNACNQNTHVSCMSYYLRSSRDCSFDMEKIIIDYLNEFDHEIVEDFALYSVYTRSLTTGYQPAVYMQIGSLSSASFIVCQHISAFFPC